MIILTIRTDKPEAEIGLFDNETQIAYEVWHAHRELSVTLLSRVETLLASQNKSLRNIDGIVGYTGPGSFTGLRIGLTVANTLAYALSIPIVGVADEENWIQRGKSRLQNGEHDPVVLPEYGASPHITQQRK